LQASNCQEKLGIPSMSITLPSIFSAAQKNGLESLEGSLDEIVGI
jgi:hypothetical protein